MKKDEFPINSKVGSTKRILCTLYETPGVDYLINGDFRKFEEFRWRYRSTKSATGLKILRAVWITRLTNAIRFSYPQILRIKSVVQILLVSRAMKTPMDLMLFCLKRAIRNNNTLRPAFVITWWKHLSKLSNKLDMVWNLILAKLEQIDLCFGKRLYGFSYVKASLKDLVEKQV